MVPLKSQPVEALADCENAAELIEPPAVQDEVCYVLNRTSRGKLHRVRHTFCFWYFARSRTADYQILTEVPDGVQQCSKCFQLPKASAEKQDDDSDTSSSSSSS